MAKVIISAFSDEYNRDIDKQIDVLSSRGVKYIEPRFVGEKNISDLTECETKELRAKLDCASIGVSSIGSPLGKINLADDFDHHLEVARRTYNTANILGTKNIRMFSFYLRESQTRENARGEVIEKLGKLVDLASKYGVTLCHENEANIYGETEVYCKDILDAFGGKLRCVFDMGNFVLDGCKPYPDGYEMLKEYIEYFHIKDSLARGAIVPAGKGEAHIQEILSAHMKYAMSDFFITLEPHLETFSGLNKLATKAFDNPYKFESAEAAFLAGLDALEEIATKL